MTRENQAAPVPKASPPGSVTEQIEDLRVALALVTGGLRAAAGVLADQGKGGVAENCAGLARIGERALGLVLEKEQP